MKSTDLDHSGDDDYFSSDLDEERLAAIWADFGKPVLILLSEKDQFVPNHVEKGQLLKSWMAQSRMISSLSGLVFNADHEVSDPAAQRFLASRVFEFLEKLMV
jgi:hypothetical protein